MKKIAEILKEEAGKRPVFSFEFFPPKKPEGEQTLMNTIQRLKSLDPDFVSVTYGAGGSTREKTRQWVKDIQDKHGITAMAHYTCVGHGRAEILSNLKDLYSDGIRNIMALRGDPPKGEKNFTPPEDGFAYGSQLIEFIRSTGMDFSLGGGGYPETHMEAPSAEQDLQNLKKKVDAGAEFIVTQLFFRNDHYFRYVKQCREIGITVPIVPGIMPITSFTQIEKFTEMAGCEIPNELTEDIKACGEDRGRLLEVSLGYSIRQCRDLLKGGAPGIHFYTLNQSQATSTILKAIN
ncbi:MAG: methylenetetrahydrofolate reductase [NAD(P)H] [Spirochaetaceae bacterium]|nr:methylenetetrahydrofolate reductase [NAD(P)H] [Spirochaetaceae bacterium]|tara:strand:- start:25671 stop:26546 length:876 start_codon:yes stop_codon:yes gene_type:complete